MLPASASSAGRVDACVGCGAGCGSRPARKRSTIAAISSRLILPGPAATGCVAVARVVVGCGIDGRAGVATVELETAGRTLFTGRVSNATRLMSIKCSGETLSDVTFPPHEPQPNVIDGGSAVENPIAPCVVGVLTVIRDAGISLPKRTAASRERVCTPAV